MLSPFFWAKDPPECVEHICTFLALRPKKGILVKEPHRPQSSLKDRGRFFGQGLRMTHLYQAQDDSLSNSTIIFPQPTCLYRRCQQQHFESGPVLRRVRCPWFASVGL